MAHPDAPFGSELLMAGRNATPVPIRSGSGRNAATNNLKTHRLSVVSVAAHQFAARVAAVARPLVPPTCADRLQVHALEHESAFIETARFQSWLRAELSPETEVKFTGAIFRQEWFQVGAGFGANTPFSGSGNWAAGPLSPAQDKFPPLTLCFFRLESPGLIFFSGMQKRQTRLDKRLS